MKINFTPGLVSIIVASYNHGAFLKRRMDSLIKQTYTQIEIIVIDDCSSDDSWEILQDYAVFDSIRLIQNNKNIGWVEVSNQGAKLSRGEYILFANCDDACNEKLIEILFNAIKNRPQAALAFCRSAMIDSTDKLIGDDFSVRESAFKLRCKSDALLNAHEMRRFLMHSCVIPNLSATLIRRETFILLEGFTKNYKACSDWEFFFRLAEKYQFVYKHQSLNYFRQHETTIRSQTKRPETLDEFFKLLLPKLNCSDFTVKERIRFRIHIMYLWVIDLLKPPFFAWFSFFHHLRLVYILDILSLSFLPIALLIRIAELPNKLFNKLLKFR